MRDAPGRVQNSIFQKAKSNAKVVKEWRIRRPEIFRYATCSACVSRDVVRMYMARCSSDLLMLFQTVIISEEIYSCLKALDDVSIVAVNARG